MWLTVEWCLQHEYETRAKTAVGTWAYMPPEILSGGDYDPMVSRILP